MARQRKRPAAPVEQPDLVSRQYERWIFPEPIEDLAAEAEAGRRDGFDPSHAHPVFWPNGAAPAEPDILIAGCGSNQAASIAFQNPHARVLGIDLSATSLAHEQRLKDRHQLGNLELLQLPIEQVAKLGRSFDLVISTGVIHHIADPLAGVVALKAMLRRDGVLGLMLYGRYGRIGAYMLQELFRMLDLEQDDAGLEVVKQAFTQLPGNHPAVALREWRTTKFDAGLVDLFLHRRDLPYTVPEVLDLARRSDLVFQRWSNNYLYHPDFRVPPETPLRRRLEALGQEELWRAMELFTGVIALHSFVLCRKDRPEQSYRVDFDGPDVDRYVPSWHHKVGVTQREEGSVIALAGGPKFVPTPVAAELLNRMDGQRTLAELAQGAADPALCRRLFRSLWRASFIEVRIPASAG